MQIRDMHSVDQTLSRLKRLFSDSAFEVGHRVPPERVLASELGVGRGCLRRALDVLEQEGQILRRQGRGTFITNPRREPAEPGPAVGEPAASAPTATSAAARLLGGVPPSAMLEHTNPLEMIEYRLTVEPAMARLAALRASQCDMRKLQRIADETRDATEEGAYQQADEAFHRAIAEASRNVLFLSVFDLLNEGRRDAVRLRLGENVRCFKRQAVHAASHQEIVDAIVARDGAAAQDAMHRHLSDVQQTLFQHAYPAAPSRREPAAEERNRVDA